MKISKPALFVDEKRCRSNIRQMIGKARSSNVGIAPHFKTHQSRDIGKWFRDEGVEEITVSSITMARYFIEDGWTSVFIAIPLNVLELEVLKMLSVQTEITVLVADLTTVEAIQKETLSVSVYIEIDCGYHRSGVHWTDMDKINEIVSGISSSDCTTFRGFYCHDGNTYSSSEKEIKEIHNHTVTKLNELKSIFDELSPEVSMGDTPSCSLIDVFEDIDIIRPGNFVFYDLVQESIGSCSIEQVAVAMVCPVISVYKDRGEVIIYGGGVHFSKDRLNEKGSEIYGIVVQLDSNFKWGKPVPGCFLKSISQEHGIVKLNDEYMENIEVGSYLAILPVHSCMTADKMGFYLTTNELNRLDHLSGRPEYYRGTLLQ